MSEQKPDYGCWGTREMIEKLEEQDRLLEGSVYKLKGGLTVLTDISEEIKRILKLPDKEQVEEYANYIETHEKALHRFQLMLGETQNHNAYMEYLEELISGLEPAINKNK